jgi:transcriptional regulator with XRE-family HTH domain
VETEDLASARIGARVHELRIARDWSSRELALRVGLSRPELSRLEDGERLPSIATLYRLAGALGVFPGDLLPPSRECPRIEVHLPITDDPDSSTARVIGGGPGNPTQIYLFDLRAGEGDSGFGTHRGEELLVVVEGDVIRSVAGGDEEIVHAGESRVIDTRVPHGVRAADSGPARFLLVCTDAAAPR